MPSQFLSVNATAAAGLVPWSCGAPWTRKMQSLACQRHRVIVVFSRVAWRACVGNSRARMGNNHDVNHAATRHRHGEWILGVWRPGSHPQMRHADPVHLFGPLTPQFRGKAKCVARSILRDRAPDHPRMLLFADVAVVSINRLCPRKGAMCLRMNGPLALVGHRRPHATGQLAGQYVNLSSIGSKGRCVAVRVRAVFQVAMPGGILATIW
jgi:hypothetical protein